jgi:phosphatidylinositol-3-phosphatase
MKTIQSLALLNAAAQACRNCSASALRQWLLAVALVLPGLAAAFAKPLLPMPDHIVIVIEENHSYDEIIGSPSNVAPYIKELAKQGASFTDSHGLTHPSQPNYLHLFSGDNQGVTTDDRPGTLPFNTPNLAAELFDRNLGFTGYSEDLPEVGSDVNMTNADKGYVRKHNPWVNWQSDETGLTPEINQPFFPLADQDPDFPTGFPSDFAQLPAVSIVVPNELHDMHTPINMNENTLSPSLINRADTWLKNNLGAYIEWAQENNSLFILTWDENDAVRDKVTMNNRIPTIMIGPKSMVRPGQYNEKITHHNVLRTIEDMHGLDHAGKAATATAITSAFVPQAPARFTEWDLPAEAGEFPAFLTIDRTGLPGTASPAGTIWYVTKAFPHYTLVRFAPGSPIETGEANWTAWELGPLNSGNEPAGLKIAPNDAVYVRTSEDLQRIDPNTNLRTRWFDGAGTYGDLALAVDPGTDGVAVYNLFAGLHGRTSVQKLVPVGPGGASLTRWVVSKGLFSNGFGLGLAVKPGTSLVYFSDPDPENPNIGELDTSTNKVRHWPVNAVGGLETSLLCIDGPGDVWVTDFVSNQIIRLRVATNELTGFPIPTQGGQPFDIACDTVIGFTENYKIGYLKPAVGSPFPVVVDPSEDMAEVTMQTIQATPRLEEPVNGTAIPISSSQPVVETSGPRPVETGNFYEVRPPLGSFPQAIDLDPTGPAGTVYFTALRFATIAPSRNHIGRVTLPAPSDVTTQVSIMPGTDPVFNNAKQLYEQQVTLQNTSGSPISGPLMLVLKDLSSDATLVNETGTTLNVALDVAPSGRPFITLDIGPDGVLIPLERVSITLEFDVLPINVGVTSAIVLAAGVP